MQFPIRSVLYSTACVAAVVRLAVAFELAFWFYVTPLVVAILGGIAGRYVRRPAFGAVTATAMFTLYVLTIPLLEEVAAKAVWPFRRC